MPAKLNKNFHGLFITGTDTDVGKTYITAIIARQLIKVGLNPGVYKPACSGSEKNNNEQDFWNDVEILWNSIGKKQDRKQICPQCFKAPLAPPVAAEVENKKVDPELIQAGVQWWKNETEILLIEGVGGFLCPLTADENVADFAVNTGFPVVIVARLGLGTINHTLLTVEAVLSRGLTIAGIILNENDPSTSDLSQKTNADEICKRTNVPVLGIVPHKGNQLVSINERTPIKIKWSELAQTNYQP